MYILFLSFVLRSLNYLLLMQSVVLQICTTNFRKNVYPYNNRRKILLITARVFIVSVGNLSLQWYEPK